ncbi:hypothetical protein C8R43DRAFT_943533 [Mycena crocata]|nr:hypothetical protein C8R43DRAFT_943533 [Mycena crocata]
MLRRPPSHDALRAQHGRAPNVRLRRSSPSRSSLRVKPHLTEVVGTAPRRRCLRCMEDCETIPTLCAGNECVAKHARNELAFTRRVHDVNLRSRRSGVRPEPRGGAGLGFLVRVDTGNDARIEIAPVHAREVDSLLDILASCSYLTLPSPELVKFSCLSVIGVGNAIWAWNFTLGARPWINERGEDQNRVLGEFYDGRAKRSLNGLLSESTGLDCAVGGFRARRSSAMDEEYHHLAGRIPSSWLAEYEDQNQLSGQSILSGSSALSARVAAMHSVDGRMVLAVAGWHGLQTHQLKPPSVWPSYERWVLVKAVLKHGTTKHKETTRLQGPFASKRLPPINVPKVGGHARPRRQRCENHVKFQRANDSETCDYEFENEGKLKKARERFTYKSKWKLHRSVHAVLERTIKLKVDEWATRYYTGLGGNFEADERQRAERTPSLCGTAVLAVSPSRSAYKEPPPQYGPPRDMGKRRSAGICTQQKGREDSYGALLAVVPDVRLAISGVEDGDIVDLCERIDNNARNRGGHEDKDGEEVERD